MTVPNKTKEAICIKLLKDTKEISVIRGNSINNKICQYDGNWLNRIFPWQEKQVKLNSAHKMNTYEVLSVCKLRASDITKQEKRTYRIQSRTYVINQGQASRSQVMASDSHLQTSSFTVHFKLYTSSFIRSLKIYLCFLSYGHLFLLFFVPSALLSSK